MIDLTLAMTADDLPASGGAIWQGRSGKPGVISIEEMLEQRLIEIRKEHMQWAYEVGQRRLKNGRDFQSALKCGHQPSMWWTSLIYERHPKLSPNLYTIYKLRCVEILLRESASRSLFLKGGERRIKGTLATLCKEMGLKFYWSRGQKASNRSVPAIGHKIYECIPAPLRALARFCHWWVKIKRHLPKVAQIPKAAPGSFSATIATYFPNIDMRAAGEGRFKSRYWEKLHDILNKEAEAERPDGPHFVRWLLIRFPSPDLSFSECMRLRDIFQKEGRDGLSFNFLEEFLGGLDFCKALRRWASLSIQSIVQRAWFARNCRVKNSALNFWPYMREQWGESLAGWRSLERCLFALAFDNYYRLAGHQRWTLFPLENCPWERMLTVSARTIAGNGPVYGAQHSTIRPTDFRYFDAPETFVAPDCNIFQPDLVAGNGRSACSQWLANGMPEDRLRQVEALRYLYLARDEASQPQFSNQILPPEAGEPLDPGAGKRLLIVTSFFEDETSAHLRLVKNALDKGILDSFRLVLKPHPYLLPELWLTSLPTAQRERIFVSHAPLGIELRPGTIVWASNSTTASLEAALKGLPIMVMAPSNDFDLCPIQDIKGLLRTGSVTDVQDNIEKLLPLKLEPDYLDLNPDLPAWKRLLNLTN